MSFPTLTFSGTAAGSSGTLSTTGTFTAQLAGNADGSVSGTWSFSGTYQDTNFYYGTSGSRAISGTLTGTGDLDGPWTLVLAGGGIISEGVMLSYANGQYAFGGTAGFGVDYAVDNGYGDAFTRHDQFDFSAHLAATGTAPGDNVTGTSGADQIAAPQNSGTIDGGAGIDTMTFTDSVAGYSIAHNTNGTFSVNHTGGASYTLVDVERLQFADAKLAIDIDGHGGEAYRLYQAAFHRTPDVSGLGFQINALDQGLTLSQVAGNFIASPEFQATYGQVSDTQFIQLLYQNVLHRVGEDAGVQFHLNELANGESRADLLTHFSESPENQANVIGQIENGMVFVF